MTNIAITIAIENCIWNCIGFFADRIPLFLNPEVCRPNSGSGQIHGVSTLRWVIFRRNTKKN